MTAKSPPPPPRRRKHGLSETDLHFRQSVIALLALALLLTAVVAVFYFFGPVPGAAAGAAASPFGVAFFKTLSQIGRKL